MPMVTAHGVRGGDISGLFESLNICGFERAIVFLK